VLLTDTDQAINRKWPQEGRVKTSSLDIFVPTQQSKIKQVCIVPRRDHYVVEIVYQREPEAHDLDENRMAGMFIVGCMYNFCDHHHSLHLKLSVGRRGFRWVQRTPAMAAGLTNHRWSVAELFFFKVPPPRWKPPKRRGRPSKATRELTKQWY
jgi:hypothetical protein